MQPMGCDAQLVPPGESKYNYIYIHILYKLDHKLLVCDRL